MANRNVATTPVTRGAEDTHDAQGLPREIISDAPMCVRLDPVTGEFREEPVLERQPRPMRFMVIPRPPAQLASYVTNRHTGTG